MTIGTKLPRNRKRFVERNEYDVSRTKKGRPNVGRPFFYFSILENATSAAEMVFSMSSSL